MLLSLPWTLLTACVGGDKPANETGEPQTDDPGVVLLSHQAPTEADVITTTWEAWDGEVQTAWFVDEVLASSAEALTGDHFDKGQTIRVELTPFDDAGQGEPMSSNTVVAVNSDPTATLSFSPETPDTDDVLTVVVEVEDLDPADEPTVAAMWSVDGEEAVEGLELHPSFSDRDQTAQVSVEVDDGTAVWTGSLSVTIANSAPTTPGVFIVRTWSGLTCSIDAPSTDADGDAITYGFLWFADGVATAYALEDASEIDTVVVPASATSADEEWICEVTASDGDLSSDPGTSATQGQAPLGSSEDNPGASCQAIYDTGNQVDDLYWLDVGAGAFETYCLMTESGGGWTLLGTNGREGLYANGNSTLSGDWSPQSIQVASPFGTPSLEASYKSEAFGGLLFTDLLFETDAMVAVYEDVGDGTLDYHTFQSAIPLNNFGSSDGYEWAMTSGTLSGSNLCTTALYIHPKDLEGGSSSGGDQGGYGPTWSHTNNSGCPLDDSYFHTFTAGDQSPDVFDHPALAWGEDDTLRMWAR